MKWKGNPNVDEMHRHDYRWIKDKKEREKWIMEHYYLDDTKIKCETCGLDNTFEAHKHWFGKDIPCEKL